MDKLNTVAYNENLQLKYAKNFDCGNDALSSFLRNHDSLDDSFGKTFVMLRNDDSLIGYYNISTGHIEDDGIRLGGAIYINCLAVGKEFQRFKIKDKVYLSDILLADCINRISELRNNSVGFAFVTLSSTDEGLNLYERNGFEPLGEDMKIAKNSGELQCVPMYLPLDYE